MKTKDLFAGHDEATHQVTTAYLNDSKPIDLYALGYVFAVEKLDPKMGRVTASQVEWKSFRGDSWLERTNIPMVDCRDLLPSLHDLREGYINNKEFNPYDQTYRDPIEFICPNTTSLLIQGQYSSTDFKYIEVRMQGCELPEEECDESAISGKYMNLEGMQSFVDFSEADKEKVVVH